VLGILMYFNIHSGSCAPAERDLPSLVTVFSQTLSESRLFIKRVTTEEKFAKHDDLRTGRY